MIYRFADCVLETPLYTLRTVRTSVGDSGQAQSIIQTQRGYGHRFVADLELLPEAMSSPALPLAAPPSPLTAPPMQASVRPCAACHYINPEDATFCGEPGDGVQRRPEVRGTSVGRGRASFLAFNVLICCKAHEPGVQQSAYGK